MWQTHRYCLGDQRRNYWKHMFVCLMNNSQPQRFLHSCYIKHALLHRRRNPIRRKDLCKQAKAEWLLFHKIWVPDSIENDER